MPEPENRSICRSPSNRHLTQSRLRLLPLLVETLARFALHHFVELSFQQTWRKPLSISMTTILNSFNWQAARHRAQIDVSPTIDRLQRYDCCWWPLCLQTYLSESSIHWKLNKYMFSSRVSLTSCSQLPVNELATTSSHLHRNCHHHHHYMHVS